MRILITNDDSISSPGLLRLADWARKLGDVTVVAPKVEQSGKSQSIDIFRPFEVKKVDVLPGIDCYYVDSTPADCVRFAIGGLNQTYDLVFSGINKGYNMGQDIIYSGTVGAIFEAASVNIPAIALSTTPEDFSPALNALDRIWAYFEKHRLFSYGQTFNINIPPVQNGIRITRQGGAYYRDNFVPDGDGLYRQVGHCVYKDTDDLTLDTNAVHNSLISISPLTVERTDIPVLEALSKAGL